MSLLTSGSGGFAGLRSAEVFGARELVARVINDFIRLQFGWGIGAKAVDLARESDYREQ